MNILVCVSNTPDTTARISFTPDGAAFNREGVQFFMNPYDEWYALVRAVEIKESVGAMVTMIHVGPASNDMMIRKGLAIGADTAVRIDADPESAFFVAHQIAAYARENDFDLILLGKETIDHNGSLVGAMLSELLDLPFISHASQLELEDQTVRLNRDIEGGFERVEVDLPLVVSASKGMAEQRIPNMRGILMAKRKPIEVRQPIPVVERSKTIRFELPPPRSSVKMIAPDQMAELVRLLEEEARVI